MKKNVTLWVVTVLFSIVIVAMFIVAMIDKWGWGAPVWFGVVMLVAWLLKQLFKKAVPKPPVPPTKN